jgi:hypothetical protein
MEDKAVKAQFLATARLLLYRTIDGTRLIQSRERGLK